MKRAKRKQLAWCELQLFADFPTLRHVRGAVGSSYIGHYGMYRLAGILGGIWVGLCMAAFCFGAIFTAAGAPRWLPLPWSGFQDFVEGPDGRVYVGLELYLRVLCYSREGQFIASYPPPSGKNVHMAADARGHIYCLSSGGVGDNLGTYNGDWQLLREYSEPYNRDRVLAVAR